MKESILEVARRADLFFKSPIHDTMRRPTKVLQEMKIPFAVAAMAANAHGHQRTVFLPTTRTN